MVTSPVTNYTETNMTTTTVTSAVKNYMEINMTTTTVTSPITNNTEWNTKTTTVTNTTTATVTSPVTISNVEKPHVYRNKYLNIHFDTWCVQHYHSFKEIYYLAYYHGFCCACFSIHAFNIGICYWACYHGCCCICFCGCCCICLAARGGAFLPEFQLNFLSFQINYLWILYAVQIKQSFYWPKSRALMPFVRALNNMSYFFSNSLKKWLVEYWFT